MPHDEKYHFLKSNFFGSGNWVRIMDVSNPCDVTVRSNDSRPLGALLGAHKYPSDSVTFTNPPASGQGYGPRHAVGKKFFFGKLFELET